MITKLIYNVNSLSAGTSSFMVNGFLTAIIDFHVTEITGSRTFNIFGSLYPSTDGNYNADKMRPKMWLNGVEQNGTIVISEVGDYRIIVNLVNVKYLTVGVVDYALTYTGTCRICTIPQIIDGTSTVDTDLKIGGYEEIIDVRGNKQIDINLVKIAQSSASGNRYLRIYKSSDGATWENFTNCIAKGFIFTSNWISISDLTDVSVFANVETVNYVKIKIDAPDSDYYKVGYTLSDDYMDRELLLPCGNNTNLTNVKDMLKGYRYVKVGLNNQTRTSGDCILQVYSDVLNPDILDGKYKTLDTPYQQFFWNSANSRTNIRIIGNADGGAIVLDFKKSVGYIRFAGSKSAGAVCDFNNITLTLTNSIPNIEGEDVFCDKQDYKIVKCKRQRTSYRDVFNDDVLEYDANNIYYFQYGYDGLIWKCGFNSDNVDHYIEGETIKLAYLMPYEYSANVGTLRTVNRIVVFTNKNRILFNNNTTTQFGDFGNFVEARVTNPYKKWQAVNNVSEEDAVHKYFPVLKGYDYNQFSNRSVAQGTVSNDLLLDFAHDNCFETRSFNSISRTNKATLFANYNGSDSEPIVIGTVDGGKTWKVVTWFGVVSDYPNQGACEVDLSSIQTQSAYVANSLTLKIRKYRVPSAETKEPANTFIIDENDSVAVSSFSVDSNGNCLVNLAEAHNYGASGSVSPICFFVNSTPGNAWDAICNNGMTEANTNNNGVFFRLSRISDTQYKMKAMLGNPYETELVCRHIHCINKSCAGFVISTGESYKSISQYEGGFVYLLTCNYNNGTNVLNGGIDSLLNKTIRLTSSMMGVNRACGAYLFNDNADPTLLYVSDESFYTNGKRNASIPDRTIAVQNVPTGIFRGKLSDIDDQSKYECVCDTKSTVVSLCEWMGHFAADGHGDALCLSKDGKNWNIETNIYNNTVNGVDVNGNIYFGDYKVLFK